MAQSASPEIVADILREQSAIYIMPRFRQLLSHEIMSKTGPTDLVTVADQEMERALIDILPKILPGSIVLGEEGISSGDIRIEELEDVSRPVWVTDPVDGTYNFAHGTNDFCTMLALVVDGQTVQSWIYDPVTGRMMIASRGEGAFLDQRKLSVKPSRKAAHDMTGFMGIRYFPTSMRPYIEGKSHHLKSITTLGCAGHEYLRLAQDMVDFSIYTRIKPWDHLAGQLMVEEAGGYLTKWDGTPYTPQTKTGGIVAVTEKDNWQPLHDLLLRDLIEQYRQAKSV